MGVLYVGFGTGLALDVRDSDLPSVYEASKRFLDARGVVSFCAPDAEDSGYLQIDATVYVPEVRNESGDVVLDEREVMFLKPVFTQGSEPPVDDVLVDQLLQVMEKTDGCIVFTDDLDIVLDPEVAQRLRLGAKRINPFEDIIFPNPSHD